jgi:hypothetical protein
MKTYFASLLLFTMPALMSAQTLSEQKRTVTFIFGTVHPQDAQKRPLLKDGKPVALNAPVGTGFFVSYPEAKGGPGLAFIYLVTNRHVLKDMDGSYFKSVKLRLNLQSPVGEDGSDLETEVPVSNENGKLLWFHTENKAHEERTSREMPLISSFFFLALLIN